MATHRPGTRRSSGVSGLPSRERLCGRTSPSTRFQPTRSRDGRREGHSPRHENDAALGREWFCCDAQTGMPSAEASGAICVQRFDDSRNSAIHITYRISLRSSSMQEPRYPLLRVVIFLVFARPAPASGRRPRKGFQSLVHLCFRIGGKNWGAPVVGRVQGTLPSRWRPLTPVEFTTRGSRLARTYRPRHPHSPHGCLPRGFRVPSFGFHAARRPRLSACRLPTGNELVEVLRRRACRASRHDAPGFRGTVDR